MLPEPSAFAAKYDEGARRLQIESANPRARWPIMWTIVGSIIVSIGLWALIIAAARALWSLFTGVHG